jgi:hypothetical protein
MVKEKKIKNHKNKDEILTSKHNNKKNQVCNMFFYIKNLRYNRKTYARISLNKSIIIV